MTRDDVRRLGFESKAALVGELRAALHRYAAGLPLGDRDARLVRRVLDFHPIAERKIGCGIRVFYTTHRGRNKHFAILHEDGSSTDFSFMKCVYGEPGALQKFRAACRNAVWNDTLKFKEAVFAQSADQHRRVKCQVSGRPCAWVETHVDHIPPLTFVSLCDAFITSHGVDPETVVFTGDGDNETKIKLADRKLIVAFRRYHGPNAMLRVVHWRANLSDVKREANRLAREDNNAP